MKFLGHLLIMALFAAAYVSQATYDAPMGGFTGTPEQIEHSYDVLNETLNVPTWTKADARAFPGCMSLKALNHGNPYYSKMVIVRLNGERDVLPLSTATFNYIKRVGDIWVIGKCR